ncbi:MAG: hypothetical protein ACR2HJ_08820 [Fimbriimonadales bacterium]
MTQDSDYERLVELVAKGQVQIGVAPSAIGRSLLFTFALILISYVLAWWWLGLPPRGMSAMGLVLLVVSGKQQNGGQGGRRSRLQKDFEPSTMAE